MHTPSIQRLLDELHILRANALGVTVPAGFFRVPCTSFSLGARGPNLAAPVVQTATALIADTPTERGIDFSAE